MTFKDRLRHIPILLFCAFALIEANAQNYVMKTAPLTPSQEARRKAIPLWKPSRSIDTELPVFIDNSQNGFFPDVFNQGSNNACSQASGVRYIYSYETNVLLNASFANRNTFCYHFTWNFLNEGNNQGSHAFLGYDLMKECGAVKNEIFTDQAYSYAQQTTWLSGYQFYIDAMYNRVASYYKINLKTRDGIDAMRRYLFDRGSGSASKAGGVATISYQSEGWGYRLYNGPKSTDIRYTVTKEGNDGPHALTLVGYDDTFEYDRNGNSTIDPDEHGAFIFINSWGGDWGTAGRCYLPYSVLLAPVSEGGLKDGDAESYIVTPLIKAPQMVFKVHLDYNRRNELSFMLGAADGENAKIALYELTPSIMNRQGGAYPMQGYNQSTEMEVAFNFDRYFEQVKKMSNPKFFLTVRRTAATGTGTLYGFSVVDLEEGTEYFSTQSSLPLSGGQIVMTTGDKTSSIYIVCSPWRWLQDESYLPYNSPFIIRDKRNTTRRLQIKGYDRKAGKLTIRHSKI